MKSIYIYASRLRSFWVLIPMSVILGIAIRFNESSGDVLKLYPLITICVIGIIFSLVYLFRFIAISYSEIKYIGRFTSRDSATINAEKTLVIELWEKNRVNIRLYGNEGYNPEIRWLTNEDGEAGDICIFRGWAYGGKQTAVRILAYFGVDIKDIELLFGNDGFSESYENVTVTSFTESEHRQIKIRFDKTV